MGYSSRDTIYRYLEKACSLDLLEKDSDTGRYVTPKKTFAQEFKEFSKEHEILNDPLVADWWEDMNVRKQGEAIDSAKNRLNQLEVFCNNLKVNPSQLIIDHETTERLMKNFLTMAREQQAKKKNGDPITGDIKNIQYRFAQAIADFCGFYKLAWARGKGGVMSRTVPNHGKYADQRLTTEELDLVDIFIKEKWGLDSDVYRWFWVGVESAARFKALRSMTLEYTRHVAKNGNVTYLMTAYESKTKKIKDGKWTKYIKREDTQKSIDAQKQRGINRLYDISIYGNNQTKFKKFIQDAMRQCYQHVQKEKYFMNHPTHALRHIGAHYWLEKGNYTNHVLVARICGWHTVDELIKSYGEVPPEKILDVLDGITVNHNIGVVA